MTLTVRRNPGTVQRSKWIYITFPPHHWKMTVIWQCLKRRQTNQLFEHLRNKEPPNDSVCSFFSSTRSYTGTPIYFYIIHQAAYRSVYLCACGGNDVLHLFLLSLPLQAKKSENLVLFLIWALQLKGVCESALSTEAHQLNRSLLFGLW